MVGFTEGLGYAVDYTCMGVIDAGVAIKRGFLAGTEGSSRAMYEIYSLQGFEKGSKAAIANMRLLSYLPGCKGIFNKCIATVEAQKDLIYATMVFDSTADFFKWDRNANAYVLRYRDSQGHIDWVKILYEAGNICETMSFLQRFELVSFPTISKFATQVGSTKLFSLNGEDYVYNDILLLNSTVNRPKELLIFIASLITAHKCFKEPMFWSIANLLKLTCNIGKIVLIPFGDYWFKNKVMIPLTFFDVITQNASLLSYWLKCHTDREDRFNNPTMF